ncbi:hypothetical protein POM88_054623 [Heracleum sosnowskyi]|uniref:PIN-like protein n=1 Tax=Heracleum sosnowskyi TaxID=360622 RepID=A0AAD8LUM7_9APIA|nr:hypothetical protein POM88_054623 [Heracleum sosnowskyi]
MELGMAMFSLGLFMASRAGIKSSEIRRVVLALSLKFLAGPAIMIASSYAIGLPYKFRTTIRTRLLAIDEAKKDYTTDEESDEADGEGDEEGSSMMMAISRCSFKLYLK